MCHSLFSLTLIQKNCSCVRVLFFDSLACPLQFSCGVDENATTNVVVPDQILSTDHVSQILDCTWLDLAIVGNIRPDWFLDDRGDDTDVQYLGNQHVYTYAVNDITSSSTSDSTTTTTPRLVKQWRKKDFASQYFTMSMLANPYNSTNTNDTVKALAENNIHWPIVLNGT